VRRCKPYDLNPWMFSVMKMSNGINHLWYSISYFVILIHYGGEVPCHHILFSPSLSFNTYIHICSWIYVMRVIRAMGHTQNCVFVLEVREQLFFSSFLMTRK